MLFQNWRRHPWLLLGVTLLSFLCGMANGIDGLEGTIKLVLYSCLFLFGIYAFYKMMAVPRIGIAAAAGKNNDALQMCLQQIEKYPKDPNLKITASGLSIRLSKPADAIRFADEALSLAPGHTLALLNKSIAHAQLILFDEALSDIEQAIVSSSNNKAMLPHLFWARSDVYRQKGNWQKSIGDCNKALEMNPKCQIALIGRASAYCFSKQYSEALADLAAAEKIAPSKDMKAVIWCTRSRVNLCLKKLEMALLEATAANDIISYLPAFPATLGLVLTRMQDFEKALPLLDRAIEIDPLYAEGYWFRHELYEATGQSDKAENDKETALKYHYKPYL
jgi:tetratricopeptide (TPR) repeat protein